MKTPLIAVRKDFRDIIIEAFQKAGYICVVVGSIRQPIEALNYDIAFIDEHFDDDNSGWRLAMKVREQKSDVRIIMIVNGHLTDYRGDKFYPYYDWIISYPISVEQLISEVEYPWNPSDSTYKTKRTSAE